MNNKHIIALASFLSASLAVTHLSADQANVKQFGFFEATFTASGDYDNPYTALDPQARLTRPDGSTRTIPLFWDGDKTWKLRISPDAVGEWSYAVHSQDTGLNNKSGSLTCTSSDLTGSIQPMQGFPHHFQYQNGQPMWFMGDTAWGLLTDSEEEKHDRAAAEAYLQARADQGFNVVHSMVLSEAGWGNSGGLPFDKIANQQINPAYWQELDHRIGFANNQGIVVGLALAWGDKRKQEPFAWRMFPNVQARKRYARYIAARYSAYHVYFLVSGEWHAEVRTRPSTDDEVRREFIEIGDTLDSADAHGRMIGIHPMTQHGSVREFNDAGWMSFGDYQQNYRDLHERLLESRRFNKPVVNSEYGYHLRDRDGDGTPDKDNSTSLEAIRHASWDIAMAGGYLVTGFGTTYFGGNRDPGPFNLHAAQNDEWEHQIGMITQLLSRTDWWKLEPHDDWLTCGNSRGVEGRHLGRLTPPPITYWLLAEPRQNYIAYARGVTQKLTLNLGPNGTGEYRVRFYSPRTGEYRELATKQFIEQSYEWSPPDNQDWVVQLQRTDSETKTINR